MMSIVRYQEMNLRGMERMHQKIHELYRRQRKVSEIFSYKKSISFDFWKKEVRERFNFTTHEKVRKFSKNGDISPQD